MYKARRGNPGNVASLAPPTGAIRLPTNRQECTSLGPFSQWVRGPHARSAKTQRLGPPPARSANHRRLPRLPRSPAATPAHLRHAARRGSGGKAVVSGRFRERLSNPRAQPPVWPNDQSHARPAPGHPTDSLASPAPESAHRRGLATCTARASCSARFGSMRVHAGSAAGTWRLQSANDAAMPTAGTASRPTGTGRFDLRRIHAHKQRVLGN